MANSFNYLVQTRNRCVVGVYGDTVGTISFGITNSAFDTTLFNDARITNSSASLSRIAYGISAGAPVLLGFGGTAPAAAAQGVTATVFALPQGTNEINFERFTVPNPVVATGAAGTFFVTVPNTGASVNVYLEFVPF